LNFSAHCWNGEHKESHSDELARCIKAHCQPFIEAGSVPGACSSSATLGCCFSLR
jgi:hypothetical protein